MFAPANRLRAMQSASSSLRGLSASTSQLGDLMFGAATKAGIRPGLLRVVEGSPLPAFTAGLIRPRTFVTALLPQLLSVEELAAVMAHEEVHRVRRDPVRHFAFRFLTILLFWSPALRRLSDDLADEAEIEADTVAAQHFPIQLASALVTLAGRANPLRTRRALIELRPYDLPERRVKRLAGVETPIVSRVSTRSLLAASLVLLGS